MTKHALRMDDLHGSLQDPAISTVALLNEVMARHPDAISFAPGAPCLTQLTESDLPSLVERYVEHLLTTRGLDQARAYRLLREYGPSAGMINDLVAQVLERDARIHVEPADIVVTVGAQEAIFLTLRTLFAHPDDVLAVVSPCYVGLVSAARMLDIAMVPVPEGDGGVDLDALRSACASAARSGRRVRALYLAPDFANPSGSQMSYDDRRALLELAEDEDLLLLEDATYAFTAAAEDRLPLLKAMDTRARVVHVGTFAKVCLPGARVGYVVADQPIAGHPKAGWRLADELGRAKGATTVNTSPISQAVVAGIILREGGSLVSLSAAAAERYQRNLRGLLAALDRHLGDRRSVSWNRPRGGFFVRMTLPVAADLDLLEKSAASFGVLWTPMEPFYLDGGGRNELRLSCSYLTPDQIEEGARRLAGLVAWIDAEQGAHRDAAGHEGTSHGR